MLQRRPLLLSVSAMAAGSLAMRRASADDAPCWRIATEYMSATMPGEGIACFAGTATADSDGTLAVRPSFDAPDGLRSATMPAAVADKRLEAADAFTGCLSDLSPLFELSALPFLTASNEDAERLLAASRAAYERTFRAIGLTLLYSTPWPATGLWTRKAVTGADDLRGLRVRTYDVSSTTVMRGAGADPRKISFADTMPLLRSGDLDAVMSSGDGGVGAKLWEHLPHFTSLNYASPLSLAFCNTAALDALPDRARAAVIDAAVETEARQFTAIVTRAALNEARMRLNGMSIGECPEARAALAQAARPIVIDWAERAGVEGSAILERFRA